MAGTGTWLRAAALLTLAVAPATLSAQPAAEEQARRLLEDGRAARRDGKVKQALDSFNIIVTGFPNTSSVGNALLEIGRTHVEVSGDLVKGREAFEQIATRYPQSDAAPGAFFYLGWLTLARATTAAELDDALAQFVRLQKVYQGSEWVPRALHAAGLVHRKARRFLEAIDVQRRAALEYPNDPQAPEAVYEAAHCLALLGRDREAMEEFQRLRNRFPQSEWAARALDRIASLYRLHGASVPSFTLDPGFALTPDRVAKDVRALFLAPHDSLWLASEKLRAAFLFEQGKMSSSITAAEPQALSLAPDGQIVIAARGLVQIGPRDSRALSIPADALTVKPLDKIAAAVVTRDNGLLVSDLKQQGILRFDAKSRLVGRFPDAKQREVTRMFRDGEGDIVTLDREERVVRVYDETGRAIRSLGPRGAGYELRHPADVAVDDALNFYVADEDAGLLLCSPQGKLILKIGAAELRRPKAVAVAADGAVFVYDDKLEKVVRFR
jgi:TolA-binding protein